MKHSNLTKSPSMILSVESTFKLLLLNIPLLYFFRPVQLSITAPIKNKYYAVRYIV